MGNLPNGPSVIPSADAISVAEPDWGKFSPIGVLAGVPAAVSVTPTGSSVDGWLLPPSDCGVLVASLLSAAVRVSDGSRILRILWHTSENKMDNDAEYDKGYYSHSA